MWSYMYVRVKILNVVNNTNKRCTTRHYLFAIDYFSNCSSLSGVLLCTCILHVQVSQQYEIMDK